MNPTNQSKVSRWIWTNESALLWQEGDSETAKCLAVAEKSGGKQERFELQKLQELQEPTLEERRRSSINIYQGQSKPSSHF